ncbi:MAG TPA: RNA methyltransferase [Bacteroidales bacterium]|jgi:tRNA G18 (ribose-2'-O)-methylase SpoU|nr:RNA methyltransferase [Bacteroidales bacterium]MDD4235501.1 RNA methyltransferase [Bacteroidales bacterium]HRW22744.1 RNA methyltransferase [Bacteroidales bacterium]
MTRKLRIEEMQRLSIDEYAKADKFELTIVLDNVRSLHNVGSVFRTADAFLIEAVFLCGITGTPPHREIHKTALGATDSVPWQYFKNTNDAITLLLENNYQLLCLEQAKGSILLNDFIPQKASKCALVIGNEVHGVNQDIIDRCHYCLEIPQNGTKHSLNVSVSTGIAIWDLWKKLKF